MKGFIITLVVTAIAIVIVTYILPSVRFEDAKDHIPQVVILALLIGLVNSFIKPIVGLLSFPVNAMTLGLFGVVINGFLLLGIAYVANTWFDVPFTIGGFPDKPAFRSTPSWRRSSRPSCSASSRRSSASPSPTRAEPVTHDALRAAARRYGTPVYVTSVAALDAAAAELRDAFPDPWLRAYSVKANDVPAIVARLGAGGLAANVVSSGEWAAAREAGIGNERVTLEGIGKTDADLRAAVRAATGGDPLRWVAVESPEELDALERMAGRAGLGTGGRPRLDVLLRLNPDVTPETHAGLAVGRGTSKFGMTETELTAAVAAARAGRAAQRARHPPPRRLAAGRGRCVARRRPTRARAARPDRRRTRRGSTRSTSAAASRSASRARSRRPITSAARRAPWSRRCRPIAGRRAWPSNRDGSSWPVPAGW